MIELLKSKDSRYKCYIIHRVCFDFPKKNSGKAAITLKKIKRQMMPIIYHLGPLSC